MKHIQDLGEFKAKISASLENEMALSVRKAILLRRSGTATPLNGPGDSYFGGLPRLPPHLEWPHMELDSLDWDQVPADFCGERLPMHFAAQVRLDDLPHVPGREKLPATGTLYFFQLGTFDGKESVPCRILFHPGRESFPERAPPPELPRLRAYGYQGLPEVLWRSVEFRYPMTFATADTYVDYIDYFHQTVEQHKPIFVPAEDTIYHPDEVAELILEEARAAALTQALGIPRRRSHFVTGWPQEAKELQDATHAWLSQLEGIEVIDPSRAAKDVNLCCYYANLCCQLGQRHQVPARWIELLDERVAWVDGENPDKPFSWNSFEMHQMFGNWRHNHSCVGQHSCPPDDVLLLQVDGSKQLVFSPGSEGVMHYVISAEALRHRDFAQVRLYA